MMQEGHAVGVRDTGMFLILLSGGTMKSACRPVHESFHTETGKSIMQMERDIALDEIATRLREYRNFANAHQLRFLSHLLGMTEMEAREALDNATSGDQS